MGHERGLIPLIGNLVTAFVKGFPASLRPAVDLSRWRATRERTAAQGIRQDSPNHRDMGCSGRLVIAAGWGTERDYASAVTEVHLLLDLHLSAIGLWTSEQCTGLPHGGMYLDSLVALRIAALTKGDADLLQRVDELTRRVMAYILLTSTPSLECWCCGERMPKGPAAQQQTAFARQLKGRPHTGDLAPDRRARSLEEDAWVSLRGVLALQQAGDDFGGAPDLTVETAEFPLVARPVEVRRWDGGHLARYAGRPERGTDGVCDWVMVDHRAADAARDRGRDILAGVSFSVGWQRPVPQVPRGARGWASQAPPRERLIPA